MQEKEKESWKKADDMETFVLLCIERYIKHFILKMGDKNRFLKIFWTLHKCIFFTNKFKVI